MTLRQIFDYIFEHSLSMCEPLDGAILETMTKTELTNDGFRIVSTHRADIWVGMYEFREAYFVKVSSFDGNYSSMAHNQEKARAIFNEVVDTLLAT